MSAVFHNAAHKVTVLRNAMIYSEIAGLTNLRRSAPAVCEVDLMIPGQFVSNVYLRPLARFAPTYCLQRPNVWKDEATSFVTPRLIPCPVPQTSHRLAGAVSLQQALHAALRSDSAIQITMVANSQQSHTRTHQKQLQSHRGRTQHG